MLRMKRIADNIAIKISTELKLDSDKEEVISYGTFALIQILFSIILVIIFGFLFNVTLEAIIISFTISILRKYSGGVHASTPGMCIFLGTIVTVGQAILFSYLGMIFNIEMVLVTGVFTFICAYYAICKLAPVDSLAKPIKKEEKRRRMKKSSTLVLSAYLIIVLCAIILFAIQGERKVLAYSLCIYGGILWQVFTLTKIGNFVITKVDIFLNQILRFRRE